MYESHFDAACTGMMSCRTCRNVKLESKMMIDEMRCRV